MASLKDLFIQASQGARNMMNGASSSVRDTRQLPQRMPMVQPKDPRKMKAGQLSEQSRRILATLRGKL